MQQHFPNSSFSSDTELLANLFEEHGPNFVNRVNGIFSLAIVDLQSLKFFVARDRLGVKPLVWHRDGADISIASTIPSLRAMGLAIEIDSESLEHYRHLRAPIGVRTFFKGVEHFPPGHYFWNGQLVKYWHPNWEESTNDEDFIELLDDAIKLQVRSSRFPVGALLSGGIDSSYVYAVSGAQKSWTAGTKFFHEFDEADQVSSHLGRLASSKVLVSRRKFNHLSKIFALQKGEPLALPNEVLLGALFHQASKSQRVMLAGEGADELLGGYSRIFSWASDGSSFDLKEFASQYGYSEKPNLAVFEEALAPYLKNTKCKFEVTTSFFLDHHLKVLLRRMDFSSMNSGVEVRVPFLDHRLVEKFVFSPFSWKFREETSKYPLRNAARLLLGDSNAFRAKVGFPVNFRLKTETSSRSHYYEKWFDSQLEGFMASTGGLN
jgi:asparagine synthase (glutamine-hydrolysing)